MTAVPALERYRILRPLGRGGMGEVFCAQDTLLERKIALKLLRPPPVDRESGDRVTSIARMVREARAAAALEHPNIVAVYDVGELSTPGAREPFCFIAMELIVGRPLYEYIKRKDISLDTRLGWLADVARALAFAHARGIIHRDIKPDNVMIREDGTVKVLDFGLARRAAGARRNVGSASLPTLTEDGKVLGTPRFMSPEQMRGASLDGRSDQFSWGVLAYELLTGRSPWPGPSDSIQAVAQVLTTEPIPIRELDPAVPPALAAVVQRAIARERGQRFETMEAVLEALQAARPSLPAGSTRPPKSTRTRWWLSRLSLAAIGGGVLGAVAAVGSLPRRTQPTGVARAARGGKERDACRSNRECTKTLGAPAICRSGTATCVALDSEDCHVVADPGDLESEATVWVGAMFPLVGDDARSYGTREFQAVELARSDFAEMLHGMNAGSGQSDAHSLGIVACDDSVDPTRAARHLVDDVGVPAVIGFRSSTEVIDLATSIFIPRGVLTVAALNTSPMIASLPQREGQPRMVFRTTYSSAQAAMPIALLVSDVLEPEIRAELLATRAGEGPLRVALIRQDDPAGIGFADALFRVLRFNGRSALENESNYLEVTSPFDTGDREDPASDQLAAKLMAFAPHVVIHFGTDEFFLRIAEALERSSRAGAPRPRYVKPTALTPPVLAFAAGTAERRRRFYSLTSASATPTNALFVARYAERYAQSVTRTFSPNSSYDAFYVVAYAALALGREPPTGTALARAMGRLVPPGRPIDVGPSEIFEGLKALKAGENIDLNGATGRLDFDLETGDAPVDLVVLCVRGGANPGAAESVESGLSYDATAGVLRGSKRCP